MVTTRNWLVFVTMTVCLAPVACGGGRQEVRPDSGSAASPAVQAEPAQSSSSSAGLFGADVVNRCAGFGTTHAAEILGAPASAVADRSGDIAKGIRGCSFERTDGVTGAVHFSLERDDSVEEAARAYADMRDSIPIAERAQKAAGASSDDSALIEISGLGDEALWTNVNGALTVRHRNLTIQVTGPPDRKTQVAVAQKVIGLL